jgi:hypothetical protein
LQQQKSGNSQIISASQKIGGFANVGPLQKNRRIWKTLAPYRKIGGFEKYWHFTEK